MDALGQALSSLRVPNYRRYAASQLVSLTGTWMQTTGQVWLVVQLTGSGLSLGLVLASQSLPMLLLAPYAGVLLERLDRRRTLLASQIVLGVLAGVLAALTLAGTVRVWHVYLVAVLTGVARTVDSTGRQAFVADLVGPDRLRNAVTLTSVLNNLARMVGPPIAGVLIAVAGVGWTFVANTASYLVMAAVLATLDTVTASRSVPRRAGQLRAGLSYVVTNSALLVPLAMMTVIGTLTYEFQVSLPLLARYALGAGSSGYGLMSAAMGVGAVCGGVATAGFATATSRGAAITAVLLGSALLAVGAAPNLAFALGNLVLTGAVSVVFLALVNTALLVNAAPDMRGRVAGLWNVAFQGSTAIGGPVVGAVAQQWGARGGVLLGGAAAVVTGLLTLAVGVRAGRSDPNRGSRRIRRWWHHDPGPGSAA